MKYLIPLTKKLRKSQLGNKAASLRQLVKLGFDLPVTFVIPVRVFHYFQLEPEKTMENLTTSLDQSLDYSKKYAIRSSSTIEDTQNQSFAGQFASFLHVHGREEILDRIKQVWASADHVNEQLYDTIPGESSSPSMAVIIQEMVEAHWSGVAFSRNPVSGRPETIIEGVKGTGEQLVQKGVTPSRWIGTGDTWEGNPAEDGPGPTALKSIRSQLIRLKKKSKQDIDVEWVFDGDKVFFVQWRPITVNRYPVIFANHISREVLPGMIKPLVWSVNVPLVNSAWLKLIEKIMGSRGIEPGDLSRQFYYRAYFNMGTFGMLFTKLGVPTDSLENLMERKSKSGFRPSPRLLLYLPRMMVFLVHFFWLIRGFPSKLSSFEQELEALSDKLIKDVGDFRKKYDLLYQFCSRVAYYNIVIPLYMGVTNARLQKKLARAGLELDDLDFSSDFPAISSYDPASALKPLRDLWNKLEEPIQVAIKKSESTGDHPGADKFLRKLEGFMSAFGHFSESGNDFSYPPWRENPSLILQMIENDPVKKTTQKNNLSAKGLSNIKRSRSYKRAGKMRLYREMISSFYTKAYGQFRELFLAVGNQLVEEQKLTEREDIFYLDLPTIEVLIQNDLNADGQAVKKAKHSIASVKKEMNELKDRTLPAVIYGNQAPPPAAIQTKDIFRGIPASMGYFEGKVCVIKSLTDMDKMNDGHILVIPFSDVGWTPLLARAGAIVSESGGILSHAAIIARELGIPAIVSVDHACSIPDGTLASVDGQNGVLLLNEIPSSNG